jgi:hypothetical protein
VAKLISMIVAAAAGALLAGVAVAGVVSSSTAAPKTNPASAQVVNYGNR